MQKFILHPFEHSFFLCFLCVFFETAIDSNESLNTLVLIAYVSFGWEFYVSSKTFSEQGFVLLNLIFTSMIALKNDAGRSLKPSSCLHPNFYVIFIHFNIIFSNF